jgi:hypothetical protein
VFKAENTGMPAWKKVLDEEGKLVANLDELYNGDWSITKLGSVDKITDTRFSNPLKAANWLWRNRFELGEPFSLYEEKIPKKTKKAEQIVEEEKPTEDLFWNYKR